MKKTCAILIHTLVVMVILPALAQANSGDFSGAVAIGSSYAGVYTAPSNGMIVQGNVGIGTTSAAQQLVLNGNMDVLGTKGYLTEVANSASTGTTLNKLAKLVGSPATAVITGTTDTDGIIGIVVGGAGMSGNAQIAIAGQALCVFENATTAGDFVTTGSTTGGDCHDYGSTRGPFGQTIGRVLTSVSAGATAPVALDLSGAGASSNQWTTSGSNIYYNTGNVGIGTATPSESLSIYGASSYNNGLKITGANIAGTGLALENTSTGGHKFDFVAAGSGDSIGAGALGILDETAGVFRFNISASGNVGIGNTNPSYLLYVNGTAYASGAAGALSDIRHKKEIKPLSVGLKEVKQLKPVSFEWKEPQDDGMRGVQMGLIAQDVETILPFVVLTENNAEKTKGLKYNEIIPVLVKAIQEQQDEISQLKEAMAVLTQKK